MDMVTFRVQIVAADESMRIVFKAIPPTIFIVLGIVGALNVARCSDSGLESTVLVEGVIEGVVVCKVSTSVWISERQAWDYDSQLPTVATDQTTKAMFFVADT